MILMIRGLLSFQGEIILIPPLLRKDGGTRHDRRRGMTVTVATLYRIRLKEERKTQHIRLVFA
jgi:hypothetical protein